MTEINRSGFRATLHEWARRQLEERSPHAGPFEVAGVEMRFDQGFGSVDTPADDTVDVVILFRHDGRGCPPIYHRVLGDRCGDVQWSPMDTKNTVSMLNELLAAAGE